jgi:hypothetical protein
VERRTQWALFECAVGLVAILAGLALQGVWTDRAELWAALLAGVGSGLVAVGAYLGKSRYRLLAFLALIVAIVDVTGTLRVLPYELMIVVREIATPMGLASALLVLLGFVRRSPAVPGAAANQDIRPKYGWWPVLITGCVFAALGWSSTVFPSPLWFPASLISILLCVISMVWSVNHWLTEEWTPFRVYALTWLLSVATVIADIALLRLIVGQME